MNEQKRIPKINEFIEGEYSLITWKFINDFATLTTDYNPIHTDIGFITEKTIYNVPMAHGQLGVSLICALLGNTYKGIMLKKQTLDFIKPVLIDTKVRPIIRCLSVIKVNKVYDNIDINFLVQLKDNENKLYVSGNMLMFMWGDKK